MVSVRPLRYSAASMAEAGHKLSLTVNRKERWRKVCGWSTLSGSDEVLYDGGRDGDSDEGCAGERGFRVL